MWPNFSGTCRNPSDDCDFCVNTINVLALLRLAAIQKKKHQLWEGASLAVGNAGIAGAVFVLRSCYVYVAGKGETAESLKKPRIQAPPLARYSKDSVTVDSGNSAFPVARGIHKT